jgi:hypothetical protein
MKAALATCKDDIFPPGAANWWIRARSSFAGMRAVLSEPTPRVEQNPALFVTLLRCGRMIKSGPGLRSDGVQFRTELRKYLITHSFYSIPEFYELNKNISDL